MSPSELVVPPPSPKVLDYPGTVGLGVGIIFTALLVLIAAKFDTTHGALTISILIVLGFLGVVSVGLFYTIPNDEVTSVVIGGLTAAFATIVSYWLNKPKEPPK